MSDGDWRERLKAGLSEHWLSVATLGIALILTPAIVFTLQPPTSSTAQQEIQGDASSYRPGGSDCDPQRISTLPDGEAASERDRCEQAAEQYRIESNDLAQQRRMADAAEAMNDLTFAQSRALQWQTVIVFWAFIAAVAAAIYARRAADAGRQANEIAREQQRPWVVPGSMRSQFAENFRLNNTLHRRGMIAKLEWVNISQTPAVDCHFATNSRFVPDGGDWPIFPEDVPREAPGIISRAKPVTTVSQGLGENEIERLMERSGTWAFFARASYANPLLPGERWFSQACFELYYDGSEIRDGEEVPRIGVRPRGNQHGKVGKES